jgi:hypothetical protein
MYELLKRVHQDMTNMRLDIGEIRSELGSIRGHIAATNSDVHNVHSVVARQDLRLDRIERRLELRELAEPHRPYDSGSSA